MMSVSEYIEKHDDKSNLVYYKNIITGYECWREYDENNNEIHWKTSDDRESWYIYDENDNLIYWKYYSSGYKGWYKYDENDNKIKITEQEYKEVEFRKKEKEYLNRTKVSRFELMDI